MKPKVAFFDFACCEGCQLQVVNLEEDIVGVVGLVDVVEFREAITGRAPEYDIAFIEGSITRPQDEDRLRDIRNRTKVLVAFGACATTGGVNKMRNRFADPTEPRKLVYGDQWDMPHLNTGTVKAVDEVVKVDFYLHGCPINRDEFLALVKGVGMGLLPQILDHPVCVECKLKENVCLFLKGKVCIGPITRAGCGAVCPSNGAPCEGCRGTVSNPNTNAMHEVLKEHNISVEDIQAKMTIFSIQPEVSQ